MSYKQYVVYDVRSTMEVASYDSLGWARRNANKRNQRSLAWRVHGIASNQFAVATREQYNRDIVRTKVVTNLMTGEKVEIPSNTPRSCDPSTETYWSI